MYLDLNGVKNVRMCIRLSISIPRLHIGPGKVRAQFFGVTVEYEWTLSDPLRNAEPTRTLGLVIKGNVDIRGLMGRLRQPAV